MSLAERLGTGEPCNSQAQMEEAPTLLESQSHRLASYTVVWPQEPSCSCSRCQPGLPLWPPGSVKDLEIPQEHWRYTQAKPLRGEVPPSPHPWPVTSTRRQNPTLVTSNFLLAPTGPGGPSSLPRADSSFISSLGAGAMA